MERSWALTGSCEENLKKQALFWSRKQGSSNLQNCDWEGSHVTGAQSECVCYLWLGHCSYFVCTYISTLSGLLFCLNVP